jgi:hypothetical protein
MPFSIDNQGLDDVLFPALPFRKFHQHYSPEQRKAGLVDLLRVGKNLRKNAGHRRLLGVALHPWHNQTTLWWFEQGMLNLIGAAGWEIDWQRCAFHL